MTLQNDEAARVCPHEGCGRKLRADNTTGFCKRHWYDSKRKTPADGDPPRTSRRTNPRKSKASSARKSAAGIATICVSEANLDNFWAKLSLEEKAQIFERQLEGAQ